MNPQLQAIFATLALAALCILAPALYVFLRRRGEAAEERRRMEMPL